MRFLKTFILLSSVSAARYDFDFTESEAISNLDDPQSRKEFTTVFCFDDGVYFDNCKVKFGAKEELPIDMDLPEGSGENDEVEESGIIFSIEEIDVFFEKVERAARTTTTKAPGSSQEVIGSFESSKSTSEVQGIVKSNFEEPAQILKDVTKDLNYIPAIEEETFEEIKNEVEIAAESVNITVKFPQTTTGTVSITVISIVGACAIITLGVATVRNLRRRKLEIAGAYFGILISFSSFLVVIYFLIVDLSTDDSHEDEGIEETIAYVLMGITGALILLLSGFLIVRGNANKSRKRRRSSISLQSSRTSISSYSFLGRPPPKSEITENPFATMKQSKSTRIGTSRI